MKRCSVQRCSLPHYLSQHTTEKSNAQQLRMTQTWKVSALWTITQPLTEDKEWEPASYNGRVKGRSQSNLFNRMPKMGNIRKGKKKYIEFKGKFVRMWDHGHFFLFLPFRLLVWHFPQWQNHIQSTDHKPFPKTRNEEVFEGQVLCSGRVAGHMTREQRVRIVDPHLMMPVSFLRGLWGLDSDWKPTCWVTIQIHKPLWALLCCILSQK